jgi:hypothetical protein
MHRPGTPKNFPHVAVQLPDRSCAGVYILACTWLPTHYFSPPFSPDKSQETLWEREGERGREYGVACSVSTPEQRGGERTLAVHAGRPAPKP